MATYTSKPAIVDRPAEAIAANFADFRMLEERLGQMPEEERRKVGDVKFEEDAVVITTPQVGAITLRAVERTPDKVVLRAENSPVPMSITVNIVPVDAASCEVTGKMDVEIPAMLRPLVGPALQKAVDQFGNLFASLA